METSSNKFFILFLQVYPSEFGKERMKDEEISGPRELFDQDQPADESNNDQDEENDADESEYHREKLRQYQLNRLKYFYAVIECDSVKTADAIYAECDGLEYESTANKLDFRFIPDDVSFDGDTPRDVCTTLPDLSKYKPRIFSTKALQQGKVELTWDDNDIERKEISEKISNGNLKDLTEAELSKFVACSSEDESDCSESLLTLEEHSKPKSIDKYRSLVNDLKLQDEAKKQKQIEHELSWGIGLETKKDKIVVDKDANPFEKMLEKAKDKRKARKKKAKQNNSESSGDEMPSDIDLNDPYFAEEFQNGEFKEPVRKGKKSKTLEHTSDTDETEQKAAELALLLEDGDDDKNHFNLKQIQELEGNLDGTKNGKKKRKFKRKNKKQVELEKLHVQDTFSLNLNDNRFNQVFSSADYNIDPTNPNFKKTKAMHLLIEEKLKRRPLDDLGGDQPKKVKKS